MAEWKTITFEDGVDAKIATHKNIAAAHHAKYTDAEVDAIVATHTAIAAAHHAKYTDAEAIAATRKFEIYTSSKDIWRRDEVENSSFEALIAGAPTATSVIYDNDVREKSLPETSYDLFGKVVLHNITRSNTRKITGVNLATKTITTVSSSDDWADNDIITTGSQTCLFLNGNTYSRFFDIDLSEEVPSNAVAIMANMIIANRSDVTVQWQNNAGVHPLKAFHDPEFNGACASCGYENMERMVALDVIDRKICFSMGAFGAICASGVYLILRINGWWLE